MLKASPIERLAVQERPLVTLIRTAVAVGDRETATRLLDEFSRNRGNTPGRIWEFLKQEARGDVLSMRNETLPEALAAYRKAVPSCGYCVEPDMASAFERAGMPDSALAHLQRWADDGEGIWEAGVYFHSAPIAYFKLGEMYEARGDRTKAVDYYGRFTNLWREADPEFQPRVKEAKRRISELIGEPRRP
jgi:tetratricopeptide (TPR) repeat protein